MANRRSIQIGDVYGQLTVHSIEGTKRGALVAHCLCSCGTPVVTTSIALRVKAHPKKSCGCLNKGTHVKDLSGLRFGRLIVVRQAPFREGIPGAFWECLCDCGTTSVIRSGHLNRTKGTKSCGCIVREGVYRTHGMTSSREYNSWASAKARCSGTNKAAFHNYGGRGIQMCEEWQNNFAQFLEDMGPRPLGHTLERLDNSQGYSPSNCEWATPTTQIRNTRLNRSYTFEGETFCIAEWADISGIPYHTLWRRLTKYGFTIEQALTQPVRGMK